MSKRTVIKIGGSMLAELSADFYKGLAERQRAGEEIIIVHGGGPAINEQLVKAKITIEFDQGLRKTTGEVLAIVKDVLFEQMNKGIVKTLQQTGVEAVSLSGFKHACIQAELIDEARLGFVGAVTSVQTKIIEEILLKNAIPVIAPLGLTSCGREVNINADTVAASIAKALAADEFIVVTDVDGVYIQKQKKAKLNEIEINQFIEQGEITGGMIPKVTGALNSLSDHLTCVRIVSGKEKLTLNSGTMIEKGTLVP
ncbi:acetylglutamate kinase [Shouchella sp. JSM 1781072]|uniref:acetylglutamate kinase n=1 Tax=Bacillaceae TaxID=186817 RepID=UPI000C07ED97|nr:MULTISPECIES: acetylglutamate kinase [Bacillaceae]UTR05042.1 acetylglutamate kinase [Alkalihalobacillus sp. LMS6]